MLIGSRVTIAVHNSAELSSTAIW
jgi:TPR repeat protein